MLLLLHFVANTIAVAVAVAVAIVIVFNCYCCAVTVAVAIAVAIAVALRRTAFVLAVVSVARGVLLFLLLSQS